MSSKYVVEDTMDSLKDDQSNIVPNQPSTTSPTRKVIGSATVAPEPDKKDPKIRLVKSFHSLKTNKTVSTTGSNDLDTKQKRYHTNNDHLEQAKTYLPICVIRDIENRTKANKSPIRNLGEYGHEEFNGACAFFDISGFSKLASRLGKREKEESEKKRSFQNKQQARRSDGFTTGVVRGNSLLGKKSSVSAKNLMLSRAETIARQHEASLKLLPKILSERRGMGAETLAYAIKELFGKMVDRIQAFGGDIIKFAGDALICVWAGNSKIPVGVLVYHAIQCGFALSTHVESISLGRLDSSGPASSLHMHVSVGSGPMRLVHVGGESGRWEYWVAGDGVTRACDGVDLSNPGEIVICKNSYKCLEKILKRAARLTGETLQEGHVLEGGEYHMLTALDAPVPPVKPLLPPVVNLLSPLLAYCPCNVKRAVRNKSSSEDSIREVGVVFVLFNGMDKLKEAEHVGTVDQIFRSLQRSIYTYGGILRQFVVDDKGAVAVIVVGFPYFNYGKHQNATTSVGIALDIRKNMRTMNVTLRIGITTGTVFCGNVGNNQRREYAAVGANVNLAARFMGKDKMGRILCDSTTAEGASESYRFQPLGHKLVLKGVEKPTQTFWVKSFARSTRERMSSIASIGIVEGGGGERSIVGRDEETGTCMRQGKEGKVICFVGKTGFGKTALLQYVYKLTKEKKNIMSVMGNGRSTHMSILFHPWRNILSTFLLPLFQANDDIAGGIRQDVLDTNEGLFHPCNIDAANAEDVGEGQQGVEKLNSDPGNEKNKSIVTYLTTKFKKHAHLLRHILPGLGLSPPMESETIEAEQLDGMVMSCEEFRQLAQLFVDIINECLDLKDRQVERAILICDDVDLFDQHSLLLFHYFVQIIPSRLTVVCSSTFVSSSTTSSDFKESNSQSQSTVKRKRIPGIHFPFPSINFRSERSHFLIHWTILKNEMPLHQVQDKVINDNEKNKSNTNNRIDCEVIELKCITLSHATEVFEHIFNKLFGIDVASKAIALSGGNLIMAKKFIESCLNASGLLIEKKIKLKDSDVTCQCFSPSIEDGSMKLPWEASSVTAQLDLFDVFTRELAQILSVLGIDVEMRALLSIDVLFTSIAQQKNKKNRTNSFNGNGTNGNQGNQGKQGKQGKQGNREMAIRRTLSSPSHKAVESRVQMIESSLATLVAAEILHCIEISSYGSTAKKNKYEWGFSSTQVRAAVYSSLTFGVRQNIHSALTQYYRLTYPKDIEHFASIICYHAEASGEIMQAVETSFAAVLLHEKKKRYLNVHDNLRRCIGLLQHDMKTREDQEMLIGCHLKDAHVCIIMGKLELACVAVEKAETTCRDYFEKILPNKFEEEFEGKKKKKSSGLFSLCKRNKVNEAKKICVKVQKVMVDRDKCKIETAEKCIPWLKIVYDKLLNVDLKKIKIREAEKERERIRSVEDSRMSVVKEKEHEEDYEWKAKKRIKQRQSFRSRQSF